MPCIFLCVCSAWLLSLQLFLELLLVALARAFFEAFPACVDSLHYPFRISMDHKYSLWARLSKYLWDEYCIIYALTRESNHSNIHCHMQKMRRMRRCHAVHQSMTDRQTKSTLTSLGRGSLTLAPIIVTNLIYLNPCFWTKRFCLFRASSDSQGWTVPRKRVL